MSGPGRLAGVEGLRAIAAGAIVVNHGWTYSNPGGLPLGTGTPVRTLVDSLALGVTLFFALSGFLLYRPFAAAVLRGRPRPSVAAYGRNRFLRIAPAYWCILLLAALVLQTATVRDPSGRLDQGRLDDPALLLQAGALVQDYRPETLLIGLGPAWSLAVEIVFYALVPVLAVGAGLLGGRHASRRRRVLGALAPALLLLVVGLSGKLVAGVVVPGGPGGGWDSDWHSVIERSFWAQADLFAFGMAVAVLHVEVQDGRWSPPRWWRVAALALAAALFVPAAATLGDGQLGHLPQNTIIALCAAVVIAVVVVREPGEAVPSLGRLLEARVFVAAGLISYSVFLWNEPVIHWLARHGLTQPGWRGAAGTTVLLLVVTAALSTVTYLVVERPALRRKASSAGAPAMPVLQAEAAP